MVTLMVTYGHSEDNSDNHDANNNQDDQHPPIQLDPKLRRALLRVLNKLEEQDKTNLQEGEEKEQTNQTSNILNEYDFARYFNNKDTDEQIFGSTNLQNDNVNEDHIKIEPRAPIEEIKFSLYQSTDDENLPDFRTGGTFTREISHSTIEEVKEPKTEEILFDDKEKYPSTNPTPQEAIFFQIPHPIEVPDAASDKPFNDSLNVQETQYLQTIQSDNSEFKNNNKKEEITKIVVENIQSENGEIINNNDEDDDVNKEINSNDKSTNSTKNEKIKHTVEFLHAPLLAAFTVQQDQLGLPKRVIPLNYKNTGAPLLLLDPQEEIAKQKELEEKRIILEQELIEQQRKLKILQLQQLPLHQNSLNKIQEETARFEFQRSNQQLLPQPQIYDDQLRNQQQLYLQNQQRQFLESQEREKQRLLLLEQAKIRQQQQDILLNSQQRQEQQRLLLKEQERLKLLQQQEENQGLSINFQTQHQQPQPQPQDFQFQKSVDFQFRPTNPVPPQNPATSPTFNNFNNFPSNPQHSVVNNFNNFPQLPQQAVNNFNNYQSPSIELNRVNRGESSRFVGNSGFNNNNLPHNQLPNHDSQLQNLIFQSGITNEIPTTHEDLNIVSKVLSLNHETKQEQLLQQLRIRDGPQQSQFIPNDQQLRYNQQNHFQTNNQQQIQQQQQQLVHQQPQQIDVQQFRSNEQQFNRPNDQQFRSNVQEFRPNVQQFRSNEQQFRPNVQQHQSNNQFYSSQEFRASEQLFSEPSLKINKIVKAPSILIEPPLP